MIDIGAGKSTLSKTILANYPKYERLSIDATIATKHGIYNVDYPPEKYAEFQEEAADECEAKLIKLLEEGKKDIILDWSFYSRADRQKYEELIEVHGGRWLVVYLRAKSRDFLWDRISKRKREGIGADSAYDVTRGMLDRYWDGFQAPEHEGEIVVDVE
ncbi:P-loop containing nucleoside triphosphate hydrolase protein [Hypoxylon sp. FL0543]|nr:P-loop containing nucleoside triphosphate hydrolase protein [Hypoxylon sp. FL0543]